jgi:putative membrane protein
MIRSFILRFLINMAALWLTGVIAYNINPKHPSIVVASVGAAFWTVIILGFLNAFIKPLIQLFTLPISCMTLGLFSFLINAFLFWMASALIPGFEVIGFCAALLGPIALGALNGILQNALPD